MTTNEATPPVDVSRFVLDGFKSVPELWALSTPELLKTEIRNVALVVQKSKLSARDAFFEGQKRASDLLKRFQEIENKERRRQERIERKEQEAREAAEREQIATEAKVELEQIVSQLLANDKLSPTQRSALQYFRHIYLEGKRDPEIASLFEGSTRDQRYQWKRRSVDMVEPLASLVAKKYISERTKRKFASIDSIVKYADIYAFTVMEIK